jgi:hypothetical protein
MTEIKYTGMEEKRNEYCEDDLFKVYSDDEEIYSWPDEYVQEIRNSKRYKEYSNFIDKQIEKQIDIAFDKSLVEEEKKY